MFVIKLKKYNNNKKRCWGNIMEVSVVAPAYNEEKNIREFVEKVDKTLKKNNIKGEILIVDDGSRDNTGKILENLKTKFKNLRVIHNKINKGLTNATWIGFKNAKKDTIVFLPSDLESNPEEDIPKLLNKLDKVDIVVGWRYNKRQGFIKTIISLFFNFLSRLLFKIKVHDLTWIKAFRRDIINNIESLRSDWHRFFVVLAIYEGYKIKEVKTRFYPRKRGKSHYGRFGFKRMFGGFFDMLVIKFLLSFSKKPMHIFGTAGSLMFLFGFFIGCYILYLNFVLGNVAERIPLISLAILFILIGIQLFAIGFLAEFLVSIRDDLNR